jgi:hypothetical protein
VNQKDRRSIAHSLYPHSDSCDLDPLFDRLEPYMLPEPALDLSIPLLVGHLNPSQNVYVSMPGAQTQSSSNLRLRPINESP